MQRILRINIVVMSYMKKRMNQIKPYDTKSHLNPLF